MKRHPDLKLVVPVVLDDKRAAASVYENLQPWYSLYDNLVAIHEIPSSLIFNMDETSLNLNKPSFSKVVTLKGLPPPQKIIPPRMPNATLVLTTCRDGTHLETQLLWKSASVPEELLPLKAFQINPMPSSSGWQTRASYEKIMLERLLPSMIVKRALLLKTKTPILLLVDGHSSRISPKVLKYATENNIIILTLPAHSSHITQPLDLSTNGVLKQQIRQRIADYLLQNAIQKLTIPLYRQMLTAILPDCLRVALRDTVTIMGWTRSGLSGNSEYIVDSLKHGPVPVPQKRGLNISGQLMTADPLYSLCLSYVPSRLSSKSSHPKMTPSQKTNPSVADGTSAELSAKEVTDEKDDVEPEEEEEENLESQTDTEEILDWTKKVCEVAQREEMKREKWRKKIKEMKESKSFSESESTEVPPQLPKKGKRTISLQRLSLSQKPDKAKPSSPSQSTKKLSSKQHKPQSPPAQTSRNSTIASQKDSSSSTDLDSTQKPNTRRRTMELPSGNSDSETDSSTSSNTISSGKRELKSSKNKRKIFFIVHHDDNSDDEP